MKVSVSWSKSLAPGGLSSDLSFMAATESGHLVAMDGAPAGAREPIGGRNLAPRPMEIVLAGTGGCTAYDVVLILKRGRHAVTGCTVELDAERAETDPKVFTRIHFHFTVSGQGLPREAVERAIALSHEKYCSASIMLAKSAALTYAFTILEDATANVDPDATPNKRSSS